MEYPIHIANVLYLMSYSMRDVLWLWILAVIAVGFLIPYFYFGKQTFENPNSPGSFESFADIGDTADPR